MTSSKIEWTEHVWNTIVGCSRVSAGCDHCYAEGQVHRFGGAKTDASGAVIRPSKYDRASTIKVGAAVRPGLTFLPTAHNGSSLGKGARWTGAVWLLPDVLEAPLRRKKPTTYFVNSLADWAHESIVESEQGRRFLAAMFGVMAATPQHTYQILTKRPEQAAKWFAWFGRLDWGLLRDHVEIHLDEAMIKRLRSLRGPDAWPLPNVWIGASVEDQATADARIPALLEVPAAVRFLSIEPMLGPVDLLRAGALEHDVDGDPRVDPRATVGAVGLVDWVICGGESGTQARPMHPGWARSLRDQCASAGVPFFFKQWGEWGVGAEAERIGDLPWFDESEVDDVHQTDVPTPVQMRKVGKSAAGRVLDGRTWDEMPERSET